MTLRSALLADPSWALMVSQEQLKMWMADQIKFIPRGSSSSSHRPWWFNG